MLRRSMGLELGPFPFLFFFAHVFFVDVHFIIKGDSLRADKSFESAVEVSPASKLCKNAIFHFEGVKTGRDYIPYFAFGDYRGRIRLFSGISTNNEFDSK